MKQQDTFKCLIRSFQCRVRGCSKIHTDILLQPCFSRGVIVSFHSKRLQLTATNTFSVTLHVCTVTLNLPPLSNLTHQQYAERKTVCLEN